MVRLHIAEAAQPALNELCQATPLDYDTLYEQVEQLDERAVAGVYRSVLLKYISVGRTLSDVAADPATGLRLNPGLAAARAFFRMPLPIIPIHALQLAQRVLDGTLDLQQALTQSGDLFEALGNYLGYDELEFPARANYVCMAAYEALRQTLGLGPFDRQEITATTTDESLEGQGAAAAPALIAYSGIFEDGLSTNEYDAALRREFWTWWFGTAIPSAWEAEAQPEPGADQETMPFQQTVRVTVYPTGFEIRFDDAFPDPSH